MTTLTWLLLGALVVGLLSSWRFRRRMKAQHKMFAELYSSISKRCHSTADEWCKKAWDTSLPASERINAGRFFMSYHAAAFVYDDVAGDIEHVLVNGNSIETRDAESLTKLATPNEGPPSEDTIVFTSKGGDA